LASSLSSSPEAPSVAAVAETPRVDPVDYAGFWSRFLAFLIDSLILTVVLVPLMIALYGRQYFSLEHQLSGQAGGVWDWVVNLALAVATILFWRYRGATPGKMAIGAKIVDAQTGGVPSTGRLILRFFAYIASILPLGLGFLWIAIDRRKQAFHDKIARTVVIYDED
jgi:uncharacterized RDD family membrane protein YckC